ncbi:MAG TPA: DUF4038 domain-containing protein, partial [Planctomycetota bacterium]|nr:DUF4038 domain-containing protein [Planctomycetota bacterium]
GVAPFDDVGDFTTAKDAYFDRVDDLLRQAQERGILVLLAPSYLGYDGGDEGWCQAMKRNGVNRLRRYGRYLGRRFQDHPNLLWVEGGDYTPRTEGSPSEMDLVRAVAQGIREGERGSHLHTAHWHPGTASAEVPGAPEVEVEATYLYEGARTYVKTLKDFARDHGVRPFFLIESAYENEHHATPTQLRAQMYQPVLSGGTGFVFGNFPVWHFWKPGDPPWHLADGLFPGGWTTALDTPGARSATLCGEFFRSIDWSSLKPDIARRWVTAGAGTAGSDRSVLGAVAGNGRLGVAYFTGILKATVDLSRIPAPLRARWFDPSSGAWTGALTVAPENAQPREFTPPGKNADGSEDWVLLVQSD